MEINIEKGCIFDNRDKFKDRIVKVGSRNEWYAFVPDEPEIFGHLIVTKEVSTELCKKLRDITYLNINTPSILNSLSEGINIISNSLKDNIDNVDRVYCGLFGEQNHHIHYHVIPRYGFLKEGDLRQWAKKNEFKIGTLDWRRFYSYPTETFPQDSKDGFRYLGEVERSYNNLKNELNHEKPPIEIPIEMANRIREFFNNK